MKKIIAKSLLIFCIVGLSATYSCKSKKTNRQYQSFNNAQSNSTTELTSSEDMEDSDLSYNNARKENPKQSKKLNKTKKQKNSKKLKKRKKKKNSKKMKKRKTRKQKISQNLIENNDSEFQAFLAKNGLDKKKPVEPMRVKKTLKKRLRSKQDSYQQSHYIKKDCKTLPFGYNRDASIDICDSDIDIFASASYIYWRGSEQNLESTQNKATNPTPNDRNEIIKMNFEFKSGFQVALGFNFNYDNWSLGADYTRINDSTSMDFQAYSGQYLLPYWFYSGVQTINRSLSTWKYKYDMFNLALTKSYFISKSLTFTPSIALKGGFIDQRTHITYFLNDLTTFRTNVFSDSYLIGPRIKINTDWLMRYNFKIVGNAGVALLYQKFTTLDGDLHDAGGIATYVRDSNPRTINPNAELQVGLGWDRYFAQDKYHISILALYEVQYYWNQNMLRNLISKSFTTNGNVIGAQISGDLVFDGLTATLKLDF